MGDVVANISLGRVVEKIADDATKVGLLFLKTAQADATLRDHDDVGAMLAAGGGTANVEANFTNYARKTPITATITVDDTNERVDVDMPDQTYVAAGGATNNTLAKGVVFYEDAANDAGRKPMTLQDFVVTTDGSDLLVQVATAGFFRAS